MFRIAMPPLGRLTPFIAGACLLASSAFAAEDFAAYAPADAYFFVSAGDMKTLREAWPNTAIGKVWADPEVAAATAGTVKAFWDDVDPKLKDSGLTRDDFTALLPGQAAFWAEDLNDYKPDEYGFALAADRSEAPAKYIDLLEKSIEKNVEVAVQKSKENKGGVDIYAMHWDLAPTLTPEEQAGPLAKYTKHSLSYAFPEGKVLVAWDGDESIERMLRRKEKAEASLLTVPDFKTLSEKSGPNQLRLFVPVGQTTRKYVDLMIKSDPTNPPPINFETLGLYDIKDFGYELRFGADAIEFSSRLSVEANPRGLAKALSCSTPLDPSSLRAVPEKPLGFSGAGMDIGGALAELIKAAQASSPTDLAPGIGLMLSQAQMQLGVSITDDLLPALGDQFVTALIETPGKKTNAERVYVLSLKNPDPLNKALQAFNEKVQPGSIEQGEAFLGAKIYNFKDGGGGEGEGEGKAALKTISALAIGDRYAVFSADGDLMRDTVRRLAAKDEHNYFDAKKFNPPAGSADRQLCSYSSTDLGAIAKMFVEMAGERSRWEEAMEKQGEAAPKAPPMPSKAVFDKYLGVCEQDSWIVPNGFFSEGRLPNTPETK